MEYGSAASVSPNPMAIVRAPPPRPPPRSRLGLDSRRRREGGGELWERQGGARIAHPAPRLAGREPGPRGSPPRATLLAAGGQPRRVREKGLDVAVALCRIISTPFRRMACAQKAPGVARWSAASFGRRRAACQVSARPPRASGARPCSKPKQGCWRRADADSCSSARYCEAVEGSS